MRKPRAYDLYCGLGGWTEGLLAEGWDVVGFDIERHAYGEHRYPAQLVLQDVRTIHGAQFKDASLIVASPPCQEYSYMAMPWTRAKAIAAEYRSGVRDVAKLNELFDACFRIQREAIAAAGHFIPLVVENVRGAQPWVGRSRWSYGSFHLWGDVPALMPITFKRSVMKNGNSHRSNGATNFHGLPEHFKVGDVGWRRDNDIHPVGFNVAATRATKNDGGSWFNIAHNTTSGKGRNPDGRLHGDDGERIDDLRRVFGDGTARTSVFREEDVRLSGVQGGGSPVSDDGIKVPSERGRRTDVGNGSRFMTDCDGVKGFTPQGQPLGKNELARKHGSKSSARKAASARIAKIPLPLARHIARVYLPREGF